jgi:hypothetical protein
MYTGGCPAAGTRAARSRGEVRAGTAGRARPTGGAGHGVRPRSPPCLESGTKRGRLRGERHRVQCPAEAGVPAVKVPGELVVEDAGADLARVAARYVQWRQRAPDARFREEPFSGTCDLTLLPRIRVFAGHRPVGTLTRRCGPRSCRRTRKRRPRSLCDPLTCNDGRITHIWSLPAAGQPAAGRAVMKQEIDLGAGDLDASTALGWPECKALA